MASGAFLGAMAGLGVQFYSNAVRKLPLMKSPWEHLLWAGAGAYAGDWVVKFEHRTALEVEELLQKRAENNKRGGIGLPEVRNVPANS